MFNSEKVLKITKDALNRIYCNKRLFKKRVRFINKNILSTAKKGKFSTCIYVGDILINDKKEMLYTVICISRYYNSLGYTVKYKNNKETMVISW